MTLKFFLTSLIIFTVNMSFSQRVVPLYNDVPNSKVNPDYRETSTGGGESYHISKVTDPTLEIYEAKGFDKNAPAIIICPGGGYQILAYNHEGRTFAKILNDWGIHAFVLKYRLPSDGIMNDRAIGPLQDVERAIQYVRQNAAELSVNPRKIGVMGFSAGGHLASTIATKFKEEYISNPNHTSLRPDFMILGYPVISFETEVTHMGSRNSLIGENPSREMIHRFSNDYWVTKDTPPTFLVLAADDKGVLPENSIRYFNALTEAGVPVEMHIFDRGGHGFGIHNGYSATGWMDLLKGWMAKNEFL